MNTMCASCLKKHACHHQVYAMNDVLCPYYSNLGKVMKKEDERVTNMFSGMRREKKGSSVVVKIGDRFYRPVCYEVESSPFEHSRVKIDVSVDRYYEVNGFAPKVIDHCPEIKKVHFNPPATVVLWTDGTKTVVKCQHNEQYDPEKGLAMAIAKKTLGNKGNYFDKIKEWTEPYHKAEMEAEEALKNLFVTTSHYTETFKRIEDALKGLNPDGN